MPPNTCLPESAERHSHSGLLLECASVAELYSHGRDVLETVNTWRNVFTMYTKSQDGVKAELGIELGVSLWSWVTVLRVDPAAS